jgi:hypothetical protein
LTRGRSGSSGPAAGVKAPWKSITEKPMVKIRDRLTTDSVQKIVMLLLSGAELGNQLIEIFSHLH